MTVTLTLAQEIRLLIASTLIGIAAAYSTVIAWILWQAPEPGPLRVRWDHAEPIGPLEWFPGEDVVTFNEIEPFARRYEGMTW